jgi:hypothetical protein
VIDYNTNPNGDLVYEVPGCDFSGQCARLPLCLVLKLMDESKTHAEFCRQFWMMAVFDQRPKAKAVGA